MKKLILSAAIIFSSLFASAQKIEKKEVQQTTTIYTFEVNGVKFTSTIDITKDTLTNFIYKTYRGITCPVFKTKRNAYYAVITATDGHSYKKYLTELYKNK